MLDESQLVDTYSLQPEVSSVSSPTASWIGSVQSAFPHLCLLTCMPATLPVQLRTYYKNHIFWHLCVLKPVIEKLQATFQTLVVQELEKRWLYIDSTDHAVDRWGWDCTAYVTSPLQVTIVLENLHYSLKNFWQSTLICLFPFQIG